MLKELLIKHTWKISSTYAALLVETVLTGLFPLVAGRVIDGMIEGDLWAIWPYVLLCLVEIAVSAGRRFFDTRVFVGVWAELANDKLKKMMTAGEEANVIISRIDLTGSYAAFFEFALPTLTRGVMSVAIGVVMLVALLPSWCGIVCGGLVILSLVLTRKGANLSEKVISDKQKEKERGNRAISKGDPQGAGASLKRLGSLMIRISDIETFQFAAVDTARGIAYCLGILAAIEAGMSLGEILAALAYVNKSFADMWKISRGLKMYKATKVADKFLPK